MMLAVLFGAFGAHALKDHLSPTLFNSYQTGVCYHFIHTLGLIIIGLIITMYKHAEQRILTLCIISGWLLISGILLFSGSLYLLAFSNNHWPRMLTPFGGICFILGWLFLAVAAMLRPINAR